MFSVLCCLRFKKHELITDERNSKASWYQGGIALSFIENKARGNKKASQRLLPSAEGKKKLELSGLVVVQNISNSPRNHQQIPTPFP